MIVKFVFKSSNVLMYQYNLKKAQILALNNCIIS